MDQFAVRVAKTTIPTDDEWATNRQQAKDLAAKLGVNLHNKNKAVGRLFRQTLWEGLILSALQKGDLAVVSELQTKSVPAWFRLGMALVLQAPPSTASSASTAAAESVQLVAAEVEVVDEGGMVETAVESEAKQRKIAVPRAAQIWFLQWSQHMQAKHNCSKAHCWRLA
eukprot:527102-Amphidinium_carterae.1